MSFPKTVPLLYDLPHDLETRLGGGVYLYKGRAFRMSYNDGRIVTYCLETGDKGPTLSRSDPDIDIRSIELGYINTNGIGNGYGGYPTKTCIYMSRVPSRQWKQGIHPNNVMTYDITGRLIDWSKEPLIYSKSFAAMAHGEYPKLADCFSLQHRESVALSRDIAVYKSDFDAMGVYYRCKPIGYFDKRGARFTPTDSLPDWFIDEVYKNAIAVS